LLDRRQVSMMSLTFSQWKPMTLARVGEVPSCPGVYELGTLVRTVVFIGAAEESLSDALTRHLNAPAALHPHLGRLYFRTVALDAPEHVQVELLDEYRSSHGGSLPAAQMTMPVPPPPRRHLKAV
jgi:hypothetical protein